MKRGTLITLILAMFVAFSGLVVLQLHYFFINAKLTESQFSESVTRSLYQTMRFLEESEALNYLSETMGSGNEKSYLQSDSTKTICRPQLQLSSKHGATSIDQTLTTLQENFQKDFSRSKTVLNQTIFRWLRKAGTKTVSDRVNFDELSIILKSIFEENGINLPFEYAVVNYKGKEIYHSERIVNQRQATQNYTYSIQFFPAERNVRNDSLQITFPTKPGFWKTSIMLFFPSLLMIVLVLSIFVVTVYIILKQKNTNEMKNDFINNMTHEFKTPIASISLASQMLQDESICKTPEKTQYMSSIIRDETKRLSLQVEKVLQMAMFERNKSILKLTEMHINNLILDICQTFALKITGKGGKITTQLNAQNDFALIDEIHFTNILYNLLDNALKYSDKPLLLGITTSNNKENNLVITVEDNGIGIKKEDQKRIFENFFRVHTGNRHDVKGFGMGLAYVKRMVLEHKGSIKVESEPNIGTKFTIIIPTLKDYEL